MERFDDFGAFREVLCRTHMAWDIRPADPQRYSGRMSAASFGDVAFTELDFEPLGGRRGRINSADERIGLTLYLSGGQVFSHGAHEVVTRPGELLLWDAMRPSMVDSSERTHCITMLMPRETVRRRAPSLDRLCGRTLSSSSALGQILASHLVQVHGSLDRLVASEQQSVLDATLELALACFRPEDAVAGGGRRAVLLERVMRYVRERVEHETLSPVAVARALGCSTRTLHLAFAGTGMTFSALVREERLARAARLLRAAEFRALTVTEIGLRVGFCDAAHFSRCFRQRHGRSPLQFRTGSLG